MITHLLHILKKKGFSWNDGTWRNAFYVNDDGEAILYDEYIIKKTDIKEAIAFSSLITSLLSLQRNKDLTNKIFDETYDKLSQQYDGFIAKNTSVEVSPYEGYNEESDQDQKIKFKIKAIKNNNEEKEITSLADIIDIKTLLIKIEKA